MTQRPDPIRPPLRSWSAGGPVTLGEGILRPHGLVVESGYATLRATLTPEDTEPTMHPGNHRSGSCLPWTRRRPALPLRPCLDDLAVGDSTGVTYTWHLVGASGSSRVVRRSRLWGETQLELHVEPAPKDTVEWVELSGKDGSSTRLVHGIPTRATVSGPTSRTGGNEELDALARQLLGMCLMGVQPGARVLAKRCTAALERQALLVQTGVVAPDDPMRGQLVDLCRYLSKGGGRTGALLSTWASMLAASELKDGMRPNADLGLTLPQIDGLTLDLQTLSFEPDAWVLHFQAVPGWWCYSEDQRHKWAVAEIYADDNVGGSYVSNFGGSKQAAGQAASTVARLRFRPRVDPRARALRLFVQTKSPKVVTVEVPLSDRHL